MIKALIFDFDGVLAESEVPRFGVMQKSAAKCGVEIKNEAIAKMVGRTTLHFLNEVVSDSQKYLIEDIVEEHNREYKGNITKYVQPIAFSVNFVKQYHGSLVLALATASSHKVVDELTNHFGIFDKFQVKIYKEDVTAHKPDPEIYLKTVEALRLSPNECVVIEDTVVGVESALNAGMKCYVLLNGFNTKNEFEGMSVEGFISLEEDLLAIARQAQ